MYLPLVSLWTAPEDHQAAKMPPKSLGSEENSKCAKINKKSKICVLDLLDNMWHTHISVYLRVKYDDGCICVCFRLFICLFICITFELTGYKHLIWFYKVNDYNVSENP